MAKQTITGNQRHAIKSGVLDLFGESKSDYESVKLNDIYDTLSFLGAKYAAVLSEEVEKANVSSSGKLADSIIPLKVEVFGSTYTVKIEALKYAEFVSEGVNGWAVNRGSRFSFKPPMGGNRGTGSKGQSEMVKSVRKWLIREGAIGTVKNKPITNRERKQMSIKDTTTKQAITTAFMIKRQGIKPTNFIKKATARMTDIVEKELAIALKVDIINSLT